MPNATGNFQKKQRLLFMDRAGHFTVALEPFLQYNKKSNGGVAQSVEQTAHIRYVGGSIPSAAIFHFQQRRGNNPDIHETPVPGIQKEHRRP
jgi:hypothetical protein